MLPKMDSKGIEDELRFYKILLLKYNEQTLSEIWIV